jgi:hypothetical protein
MSGAGTRRWNGRESFWYRASSGSETKASKSSTTSRCSSKTLKPLSNNSANRRGSSLARRRCAHREKINRRAIILASRSVSHRYRVQLLACLGCTEASFNLRVSYRSVFTVTCGLANRLCRRFVMYAILPKIFCFCFRENIPEANLSILLITA